MRKFAWIVVLLAGCSKSSEKAASGEGAVVVTTSATATSTSATATSTSATATATATATSATTASGEGGEKAHHRKHEDRREPVIANAPPLKLEVSVQGQATTWEQGAFDRVAKYTKGTDGEARDVWSLRELVHQLVGPKARVVSVTGEDGTKVIDASAWEDAATTPLLHTTRRGTLKFRWADANGAWGESGVKDVIRIEVTP